MDFHSKCRSPNPYKYKTMSGDQGTVWRQQVPDDKVSWDIEFQEYCPSIFTEHKVLANPLADPDIKQAGFEPWWNQRDGPINRESLVGEYRVQDGLPLNVRGRTGLGGRGVLPRYGPNHAADCIVTRWKRDNKGNAVILGGKGVLQLLTIQRKDNDEWALPGGKVDPGETVMEAAQREFVEEAMDGKMLEASERTNAEEMVSAFFASATKVYQGYVDDPRNTDCAWMETTANLYHDGVGDMVSQLPLRAGDDAKDVKWMDASQEMELFASHKVFVEKAAQILGAHW